MIKTFRVEFDEITTYVGTMEANSIEEAEELIYSKGRLMPNTFEAVIGETKIQSIEEITNEI